MKILVTGIAGFIGFHLSKKLTEAGHSVVGIDNLNDYYDVSLKVNRLKELGITFQNDHETLRSNLFDITFYHCDLGNNEMLDQIFAEENFDAVCNLAAQAGVRFSLTNPSHYIEANVSGFLHILEACKKFNIMNLSYASSSSVYGLNTSLPFQEIDSANHPISMYAASKKMNELMAHTYSHLYQISTTGLRFFTVYGPWGRPDMALFKFTKAALEGSEIELYNSGNMIRDFTYIDDIVDGIEKVIHNPATQDDQWDSSRPKPDSSSAPYKIYNIGNNNPINLKDFIEQIEIHVGKKIQYKSLEMQPGDVMRTHASSDSLHHSFQYTPSTKVSHGVGKFVDWYIDYYHAGKKPN